MIHRERVTPLNDQPERPGRYVLYWMQASQRARWNHALEYAVEQANRLRLPVVTGFGLMRDYPSANLRHYRFMLEGLRQTCEQLAGRGIAMAVLSTAPPEAAVELASEAAMVVADVGYLRHQRQWRNEAAGRVACRMEQVESDVVVPVEEASDKEEWSAATLRRKLLPQLDRYLVPLKVRRVKRDSLGLRLPAIDLSDIQAVLGDLNVDSSVAPVTGFVGGCDQAHLRLERFLAKRLTRYDRDSNDPSIDGQSDLSPYLHFGQVSPVEIALRVRRRTGVGADRFLEQLIVRRELAINFVYHNSRYDSLDALPRWAKQTLTRHARDRRTAIYSLDELQAAGTHDPYWNAAQREMLTTGKMHGYMRMYWGKKILEWSQSPAEALRRMIYLNDRYFLDGRDPSGYTNILWCLGKHDRPWKDRPIFGQVRYMNQQGLLRKFDMEAYVKKSLAGMQGMQGIERQV